MAREKLKDFLRQKGSTDTKLGYTVDMTGGDPGISGGIPTNDSGLGIDPGTNQALLDLQQAGVSPGLLGDYLKYIIDESTNTFTLQGGVEKAVSTDRGNVLPYAEKQGVVEPFIRSTNENLGEVMNQYSNSEKFSDISKFINKTGHNSPTIQDETEDNRSGHTLLSSIDGQDGNITGRTESSYEPESELQRQAETMLVENSRFNPAHGERFNAYAPKGTTASQIDAAETSTSQPLFGEYNKNGLGVTLDDLESVAKSLMLKAAGWDNASDPGLSSDPNDFDFSSNNSTLTTDYTQNMIGPGVSRARNAYGAPENSAGNAARAASGEFLSRDDMSETLYTKSFGVTNTPDTPFSGAGSQKVLIAQAAGAITAMMILSKSVFDGIVIGGLSDRIDLKDGPYFHGQAKVIPKLSKFQLLKRLVLVSTDHSYEKCVTVGFKILFEKDINSLTGMDSASAETILKKSEDIQKASLVQESPGFWISVAKKVLRSYSVFSSKTSSLLEKTSFSSSPSTSLSSIMFEISKSGMIDILNVAAITGDVALKAAGGSVANALKKDSIVSPYNIDALPDNPATRISIPVAFSLAENAALIAFEFISSDIP